MPLSAAVTPTFGGAGWLLNFTQKHSQQFARRFAVQRAGGKVPLVERRQVLVQAARAEGVPGVQLGDHAQVDEPVSLQRLLEIARRVRRHAAADLGDARQFACSAPLAVPRSAMRCARSACRSAKRITASAAIRMAFNSCCLSHARAIVEEIQPRQRAVDLRLKVQQALAIDHVAQHGVSRARAAP